WRIVSTRSSRWRSVRLTGLASHRGDPSSPPGPGAAPEPGRPSVARWPAPRRTGPPAGAWGRHAGPPGPSPGVVVRQRFFAHGRLLTRRFLAMLKPGELTSECLRGGDFQVVALALVVKAVVAKVEGYRKRFTLVTSATELAGLQVVEL